ncbi:MAG: site-2 protease family protein [Clostridia bacterium]|nr:site-2 protease family protein [Clostridia bacterium]
MIDGAPSREGLLNVIAFCVALLVALVLHEVAHGFVAMLNGDKTAKYLGRLSLNPAKHFDWRGLLMMLICGFGWAKPVPVNPHNYKNLKVGSVTVALAGVATNLLLAFVASFFYVWLHSAIPSMDFSNEVLYYMVYLLNVTLQFIIQLNINFALFNLLPLYPLDGYRLLSSFINENNKFMTAIRKYSFYIVIALVALNLVPSLKAFSPMYWYIGKFGGAIVEAFLNFWRLFF